jgi:hypothetical protein
MPGTWVNTHSMNVCKWSALHKLLSFVGKNPMVAHCTGSWVGTCQVGCSTKEESHSRCQESDCSYWFHSPSLQLLGYPSSALSILRVTAVEGGIAG